MKKGKKKKKRMTASYLESEENESGPRGPVDRASQSADRSFWTSQVPRGASKIGSRGTAAMMLGPQARDPRGTIDRRRSTRAGNCNLVKWCLREGRSRGGPISRPVFFPLPLLPFPLSTGPTGSPSSN